ncbi:MAG: peptidase inhibitor I78 [Phenylobacterium sp.]
MRVPAAVGLALLLAACSSSPTEAPEPSGPEPVAARPSEPVPTSGDRCGAAEAQGLVGKLRTEIPIPIDPAKQRVACTTCPVTMDFSPDRLNFFFDAETGLIKEVRCG